MDALIRAARIAPVRTRLSEARPVRVAPSDPSAPQDTGRDEPHSPQKALRMEIEAQVRKELESELLKLREDARRHAHASGYSDGLSQGAAAAEQQLIEAREQLESKVDSLLCSLQDAHRAALLDLQSSVGEVAFAAVCRLIGHKAASQAFVFSIVEQACAQLRSEVLAIARLHPRDIRILSDLTEGDEIRIQALGLKLVPDESLRLGGCTIETASGHYDGGLESQLRRLHAVLTSVAAEEDSVPVSAAAERANVVGS